ncbi:MAG: DNA-binding domain-containing protein [Candidatus Electronema aureum]|uniref:DNA-binding domain-containing protein n=1 Tax=Candidatus Electronema aureum TaxID=2005002 RepID=A0A521G0F8_9BACT|nr:MAG: DNA-binding domain-containing protein [Candidatus Electronema aureum]
MSIQCKPEPNSLTTPESYILRFVPRNTADEQDIAADISRSQPNFSTEAVETILHAEDEAVLERLLNGEQVTKHGSFSWYLTFTGRLDNADDPLPPLDECLQVSVRVSQSFLERLRQNARIERLPTAEKLPVITAAEDAVLGLRDVLRPDGMLRITGSNLLFDRKDSGSHCLIEGTRSGSAVQSRVGTIANTEIVLMPDVPSQPDPWNNEYQLSITTRYTKHGTLRTGIYKRRLRSPLTLTKMGHPNPPEVGILTGKETSPHVSVTGGSVSANETLRIQVLLDLRADALLFSLLDMQEGGKTGAAVSVTANGAVTLQGFAGSAVTNLTIRVNNYAGLKEMLRNEYGGRVVDVLDVSVGS